MFRNEEVTTKHINSTLRVYVILLMAWMAAAVFLVWMIVMGSLFWLKSAAIVLLIGFGMLLLSTSLGLFAFIGLQKEKDESDGLTRLAYKQIMWLYPVLVGLGKLIGVNKDEVRKSYTQLNNRVILSEGRHFETSEILILTPHCLQQTACSIKVTYDIAQCKHCGSCAVGDLHRICEEYGVDTVVVTGGTLARLRIKEKKPKLIIAIACERDLISGLMDVKNIPVYAIINDRPEGPCKNTRVNIDVVEQVLCRFIKER